MTYVTKLDPSQVDKLKSELNAGGFELSQPPHTLFQGKKPGLTCTLYESLKLVIQGKGSDEFIEFVLEPHVTGVIANDVDMRPRIGMDESGKGDYFGPLVVAGVFADEQQIPELSQLGVRDSKMMRDQEAIKAAKEIKRLCACQVLKLEPAKYNELHPKFGNLNRMLAWAHATVITELQEKTGATYAIVDQFANETLVEKALEQKKCQIDLLQRTKAESDVVVAAASVIARAEFLNSLAQLSDKCGFELPKGAGTRVDQVGRKFLAKWGEKGLLRAAKVHFKNTQKIQGGEQ